MPKAHRGRPATNAEIPSVVAEPEPVAAQLEAPPTSAGKQAWVAYAEALGVSSSGTKAAIIARTL